MKKSSKIPSGAKAVKGNGMTTLILDETERLNTGLKGLSRALGGGLVKGSTLLLGGRGDDHARLAMQIAVHVARFYEKRVLYVITGCFKTIAAARLYVRGMTNEPSLPKSLDVVCSPALRAHNYKNYELIVIDDVQTAEVAEVGVLQPKLAPHVRTNRAVDYMTQTAQLTRTAVLLLSSLTTDGSLRVAARSLHVVDGYGYLDANSRAPDVFQFCIPRKYRHGLTPAAASFVLAENHFIDT